MPVLSTEVFDLLKKGGLIPDGLSVCRILIDIRVDDIVRVYYETFGPDQMTVVLEDLIKQAKPHQSPDGKAIDVTPLDEKVGRRFVPVGGAA